jgi:hypothetical protein
MHLSIFAIVRLILGNVYDLFFYKWMNNQVTFNDKNLEKKT